MDGVVRIAWEDSPAANARTAGTGGVTTLRWFVAGPENAVACAAAEVIARRDRSRHAATLSPRDAALNPIVFCGPTGVGKSHLAIGLATRVEQLGGRSYVVSAADITQDELLAPRMLTTHEMSLREPAKKNHRLHTPNGLDLRALDLLVVEDVAALRNRQFAQQQLMHHLDQCLAHGVTVLVTSVRPPWEGRELLPGLRSRLTGGLVIELALPEQPARRTLLADWAALLGTSVTAEALDLLAEQLLLAPPQLRGVVVTLACAAERAVAGKGRAGAIDAAAARAFLATRTAEESPSLRTVAAKTAHYFGLTLADLKSSSRRRQIVEARGVAMVLARRLIGLSYVQIGEFFGGRDHTTVLHSCRRTEELDVSDPATQQALAQIALVLRATRMTRKSRSRRRSQAPPPP